MKKTDLTLVRLKNTNFPKHYKEFLLSGEDDFDYRPILSVAAILINSDNEYIKKLGYRIVLLYCIKTNNYYPLYELSVNMGLYPISKFIHNKEFEEKENLSIFTELNDAFIELYKKDNIYISYEQKRLIDTFKEKMNVDLSVVAPTSYGKTELIISFLTKKTKSNVCIVTPTKSLLAQTRHRIANAKIEGINKIITHPEMYNGREENLIAVLTQERLLRLLKKHPNLSFDFVIIDEAHNLLENGPREILLASVIIMLKKRNSGISCKFLTPFLNDAKNLNLRFAKVVEEEFYINEFIKSERLYIYDKDQENGILVLYDQFINEQITVKEELNLNELSFIEKEKARKNIIYLNKPSDLVNFANQLLKTRKSVDSIRITQACRDIAEYIHPEYDMIDFIKKGFVCHHGAVPDLVRLYIETLYTKDSKIDFVLTNSTLLEGVNLPVEKLFVLDNRRGIGNLSPSSFKNLIGRICRFSDIFGKNGNLSMLSPQIYLVKSQFYKSNANVENFLENSMKIDKKQIDDIRNVLIERTELTDKNKESYKKAIEFIENYEKGTIEDNNDIRYARTEVGAICIKNNITEVPVLDVEDIMQEHIDYLREGKVKISDSGILLSELSKLFFEYLPEKSRDSSSENIFRLIHKPTQRFYTMYLNWRIRSASYQEMIRSTLSYWEKVAKENPNVLVYVGRWGDKTRGGHRELWTDIGNKTRKERVNLAIVRIKEEQDFLDNIIMKYIEAMYDLNLVEENFYLNIKYGTNDEQVIIMVENGVSLSLANLIKNKYHRYVNVDIENRDIKFSENIVKAMRHENENGILINELRSFVIE